MPVLKIRKNGEWVEVWGATSSGTGDGAPAPKLTSITMLSNAWTGSDGLYSQNIVVNGVEANTKLDLQPTPVQIVNLQDAEISLMLTNDGGVVTAWAINGKPAEDYTMSILLTEVTVV